MIFLSKIENYPSIQNISGLEYSTNLFSHASSLGVEVNFSTVKSCDLSGEIKKVIADATKHAQFLNQKMPTHDILLPARIGQGHYDLCLQKNKKRSSY